MNVGQLARQQQMMYKFINRGTNSGNQAQMKSQLSPANSYSLTQSGGDSLSDMLKSMGISGLQGRTVREMAQYQMRVQNASGKSGTQSSPDAAAQTEQTTSFSAREQYTPISDKATEAMQKLALEDAKNSAEGKSASRTERAKLIQDQLKDVEPSKRAAAFNTMNKVWESETERIAKHIKEKNADWEDWGDKFDTKLLDDYKPGVNVWV